MLSLECWTRDRHDTLEHNRYDKDWNIRRQALDALDVLACEFNLSVFVVSGVVDMLLKMLAFRVGSDPEIRRGDSDEDRNITSIQNACTLVAQRILSRIVQYPVLNGIVATRTIDWGEGKGVSGLDVMFALLCLRLRLPQIRESKDESETDSIERLVNGSCDSMSRADCIMCIDVAAAISSMIGTSEKVVEVRDILESQVLPVARCVK